MKFADLLSLAKNVPLSAFDWGQDAVMFINRRLNETQHINLENTGTDIHARLLSLNPTEMLDLLTRDIEINGTRLSVLEHAVEPPPVPVSPLPTLVINQPAGVPTDAMVANAPIEVNIHSKPQAKWPIVVASIMAAIAISLTFAATTGEQLGNQDNRNAARTTLQLVIEVLRTLNGNTSDMQDSSSPYSNDSFPSQQPTGPAQSDDSVRPQSPPVNSDGEHKSTSSNPYGI